LAPRDVCAAAQGFDLEGESMGRYRNGQVVIEVADLARARVDAVIVGEGLPRGEGLTHPGERPVSQHPGADGAVWAGQVQGITAPTVIFTKPPREDSPESGESLGRVVEAALRLALEHGAASVALGGALYLGAAPLSRRRQVEVVIATVVDFLEQHPSLERVLFRLEGEEALAIHEMVAEDYL
jgi:hypothetical protein